MAKTKQQLIEIRDSSYKPPPFERCVNCKFYWPYGSNCQINHYRGRVVNKWVDPAGVCDLFEAPKATKE